MNKRHLFVGASIVLTAVVAVTAFLVDGRGNNNIPPAAVSSVSPTTSGSPAPSGSSSAASGSRFSLLSALSGEQRKREVAARIARLRLMNYYPAAASWTNMWTNWNANVLRHDFSRIHALGANAVRIIVFPDTFGWPAISPLMMARFASTLNIAADSRLAVQVTLFDWWDSYDEISLSQAWLKSFLGPYASDPEIQLVELKNEVDPADSAEVAWVRALLPTLRSIMPRTPSTVSVSGTAGPAGFVQLREEIAGSPLDVADMHFYGEEASAYDWMLAAKRAAGTLPLFIGEFGARNTDANGTGANAAALQQAHWFRVVFAAAREAGVSVPAPWTLYDFKPGTVPSAEKDPGAFGLYSDTGRWRPSVAVVKEAFTRRSRVKNVPRIWSRYLSGRENYLARG